MNKASRDHMAESLASPHRARLTTTHCHGVLNIRADNKLALLRISKNASTELMNRLDCHDWQLAADVTAPVVMFLREPVRRFQSSIGETFMRVQHPAIEDRRMNDRVIISEDVYSEIEAVIADPVPAIVDRLLDLVEEAPFDAHHEPQISFFTKRDGGPRFDARAYTVEQIEDGLGKIAARFGIEVAGQRKPGDRFNAGGAKPLEGSTKFRAFARRMTRTGLYRRLPRAPLLASRYTEYLRPNLQRRDLNTMANRFTTELKAEGLSAVQEARVRRIYEADIALWSRVSECDDRLLSELF